MNSFYLTHKTKLLSINTEQERLLQLSCDVARATYNFALSKYKELKGTKIKRNTIRDLFNKIKYTDFIWTLEVSKCCSQQAIEHLMTAFKNFFEGRAKYPKFKKKGRCKESFEYPLEDSNFKISNNYIYLAKIGWMKLGDKVRIPGKATKITVTKEGGDWYISILIKVSEDYIYPHTINPENNSCVGIDLGIKTYATLSDGTISNLPSSIQKMDKKLRKLHRQSSRKKLGSSNRKKANKKLARAYKKKKNIILNHINNLTASIVENHKFICVEDLNVKGMTKNHKLARAIQNQCFYEFKRQLKYKALLTGAVVIEANRFFPSSKLCSCCGYKNDALTLKDRHWICKECNTLHDRDQNASYNLEQVAREYRDTLNAWGLNVRPGSDSSNVIMEGLLGLKQEPLSEMIGG